MYALADIPGFDTVAYRSILISPTAVKPTHPARYIAHLINCWCSYNLTTIVHGNKCGLQLTAAKGYDKMLPSWQNVKLSAAIF